MALNFYLLLHSCVLVGAPPELPTDDDLRSQWPFFRLCFDQQVIGGLRLVSACQCPTCLMLQTQFRDPWATEDVLHSVLRKIYRVSQNLPVIGQQLTEATTGTGTVGSGALGKVGS